MSDEELREIGETLVYAVRMRFHDCGAAHDFCIQDWEGPTIIFGGTNRVIYDPTRNNMFEIDRVYCTPDFISRWDSLYS